MSETKIGSGNASRSTQSQMFRCDGYEIKAKSIRKTSKHHKHHGFVHAECVENFQNTTS
jgi:hypothetical protein